MPDVSLALLMVKTRLNRMASDTSLDEDADVFATVRMLENLEKGAIMSAFLGKKGADAV